MRPVAIGLVLLVAVACGGGGGGGGDDGERGPADELILRLESHPGTAPPDVPAGTPIVLLVVDIRGTTIALPGAPIVQPGATLRLERALATRRTKPPALWTVVTSPDGSSVRYWTAAVRQATVRATLVDHETDTQRGAHAGAGHGLSSVRVPFEPGGGVRFYRAAGGMLASYRFGNTASDPLARVGP